MRKLKNEELQRISIETYKRSDKTPLIVVLDNVRSMHNVGAIFRTCDAFRIAAVFLCGITATPPHKDIHKTALGASDSVDWEYFENTKNAIKKLRKNNYKIVSIEQTNNSLSLEKFTPDKQEKLALIFGHEVKGVAQQVVDISDFCIEIPQFGTKHSFNISVSVGIVLWEIFRKLNF